MTMLRTAQRIGTVVGLVGLIVTRARLGAAAGFAIDFESFPAGINQQIGPAVRLDVQYASENLVFPTSTGTNFDAASIEDTLEGAVPHSGQFVAAGQNFSHEFDQTPFDFDFRSPQTYVQFWGGSDCVGPGLYGQVTGYDNLGNVVSVTGPSPITGQTTSTPFSIDSPTGSISKVRYEIVNSAGQVKQCHGVIDDLLYEGDPPPTAGAPPSISLILPQVGAVRDYALGDLVAFGTLSGSSLVPNIDFELTSIDTPTLSFSTEPIPRGLAPNQTDGTNISFTFTLKAAGTMPMGRYTLVARIRDFAGQEAQTSVDFSNFPDVLVNPGPGLGPFVFGTLADGCQMAFYFAGAEAYVPNAQAPPTFVPRAIADKWFTVDSPILGPKRTLGCPIGPSTDSSLPNWTVQDFERGRIYAPLGGTATYVPKILTAAFPTISHAVGMPLAASVLADFKFIGWPVSDPDSALDTDTPTWVFQRFAQNNLGEGFHNTLEVRGRTPSLFIERIGGDPDETSEAEATLEIPHPVPKIDAATPTQWQTFPCSTQNGEVWPSTCDISTFAGPSSLDNFPTIDGPVTCGQAPDCSCSGPDNQCDLPTFHVTAGVFKPWWATTAAGVTGVYEAIIRDLDEVGPNPGSHLADDDYPFNHDNCNVTLGRTGDVLGDVGLVALGCTFGLLVPGTCTAQVSDLKHSGSDWCRSDWNLHTRPLLSPGNYKFLARGNIFKSSDSQLPDNNHDFEVEFEATYARDDGYFDDFQPLAGDMVAIHGRSIVDCGHCDPYKAEFHPPDVVITSRSRITHFGNAPDRRSTGAWIWANAFLNATDGFDVTGAGSVMMPVYAPPRTSATAHLFGQENESPYFKHDRVTWSRSFGPSGVTYTFQAQPGGAQIDAKNGGQWGLPSNGAHFVDYAELFWADL
jgi:hypothetical protein